MHTNGAKALTLNSGRKTQVDLLLCADYNRHHGLWGGAQVFGEAGRNNEAEAIIDLMQENALTSLLPSGTVTWDHYNGSTCSTINIVLASSDQARRVSTATFIITIATLTTKPFALILHWTRESINRSGGEEYTTKRIGRRYGRKYRKRSRMTSVYMRCPPMMGWRWLWTD
jgi:hypothetical protein